jgi:hypothetical protein
VSYQDTATFSVTAVRASDLYISGSLLDTIIAWFLITEDIIKCSMRIFIISHEKTAKYLERDISGDL